MPSSHSQSIAFFTTILCIKLLLVHNIIDIMNNKLIFSEKLLYIIRDILISSGLIMYSYNAW